MLRIAIAAFVFVACSTSALALERNDLLGAWETQWSDARGAAPTGGGPMRLSADTSSDGLDGLTPASGWDGVMNGRVEPGADGALIWSGQWASIWPEGATMGTFRFVFTDADTFTGTWSSDDGEISGAVWNGQRAR